MWRCTFCVCASVSCGPCNVKKAFPPSPFLLSPRPYCEHGERVEKAKERQGEHFNTHFGATLTFQHGVAARALGQQVRQSGAGAESGGGLQQGSGQHRTHRRPLTTGPIKPRDARQAEARGRRRGEVGADNLVSVKLRKKN